MTIIGTLPVILQNGTTADASQVMSDFNFIVNQVNANALATSFVAPGSILAIQTFNNSGTYTPNANASKALVLLQGAGGAGAGTGSPGVGSVFLGTGGNAGAFGVLWITAGLTTTTVTIGAGGTGVVGIGNPGASSSFGGLMICGGGLGGTIFGPSAQFMGSQQATPANVTGTGNIILATPGPTGGAVTCISTSSFASGQGAHSRWGVGGAPVTAGAIGLQAFGFGAGGGGSATTNSAVQTFVGGNGAPGYMLVLEFA